MNINIQSIQFRADSRLTELINRKVKKLSHFYDRIIDAEVFLRLDNQSAHIKDKTVQIKLNLPGQTLMAREKSKRFEESLDMAVDSLKKQIDRYKKRVRN